MNTTENKQKMENTEKEQTVILGLNTHLLLQKTISEGKTGAVLRVIHHQNGVKEGDELEIIDDIFFVFPNEAVFKKFSENISNLAEQVDEMPVGHRYQKNTSL